MAAKVKSHPANGPHTAGIFADLSVDGPEIGTLVAVVDRAKNLPNRKTIGKQDPYCAARLGKEAKKTATDVRGGQTPRWDQELRFTVHDGPDYYQLKISVFTDDKRTELVGESWIDLKSIIVPGGGQGDVWQTLSCRGKYAGEIRLEITYYDTRPKPERPVARARPQPATTDASGSMKQRTPMGRRPLPSDPVTGEAPAAPHPAPVPSPAQAPPAVDPYQTPPRAHGKQGSHSGYIPGQSPLQSVEYQTPPSTSRYSQQDSYGQSPRSHRQMDPMDGSPRHFDEREYSPRGPSSQYHTPEPRGQALPEHFDHMSDPRQMPPAEDDRPPPPPAHRSSYGGGGSDLSHRGSFESPQHKPTPNSMRYDVLRNEAHRSSVSAYPASRPAYRPYDSAPNAGHPDGPAYDTSPRHHSYDQSYNPHPRSMQPTVEDVPDSPSGPYGNSYRQGGSRMSHTGEPSYDDPAPLNLSRSAGTSPMHPGQSPRDIHGGHRDQSYQPPMSVSPSAGRDMSTSPGRQSHGPPPNHQRQYSRNDEFDDHMGPSPGRGMPELPSSLVPGVDPALSQELSNRIHDERRQDRRYTMHSTQNVEPPRGRHTSEPPPSYGPGHGGSSYGYAPPPSQQIQARRSGDVMYSGGPEPQRAVHSHSTSPTPPTNPDHRIKRKSVSPAPPPAENRRNSDVPFGPDSFNAFNTTIATREDRAPIDPNAKIVMHDGREVDPSDHLPMDTWAPEPEAKQAKQPSPEPRARPSPSGAQPMPPSGRRPLRVAARPQAPPAAPHPSYGPQEPHTPPSVTAGRNRLHKKTRSSAAPSPAGAGSSPLAPISPENYQDRQSPYTPTRGGQRPSHYEYPNENHYGSAPPIPAKVPIGGGGGAVMSGANVGPADNALMHEMSRIDIGAGRSRRRGGY